jgi:exosortase/archaeosortase family protein
MTRRQFPKTDLLAATVLVAMALLVLWESHRRGVDAGTLGLGIASLGVFVVLGSPWRLQTMRKPSGYRLLALAAVGLVVGLLSEFLLPISLAWTAILWAWLRSRLSDEDRGRIGRLVPLTLLLFPWADFDIKPIHWAMRISAASVSQHVLNWGGLPTTREGTRLFVAGQPVEISDDCAGGETLHAMLAVGLAAACVYLDGRRSIMPWLPVLCGLAWLANTLRVLLICVAAGSLPGSPYVAWVHDAGGWLVVALMTSLCVGCFAAWNHFSRTDHRSRGRESPECRGNGQDLATSAVTFVDSALRDLRIGDRLGHDWKLGRIGPWSLLLVCMAMGSLWQVLPLPDAQEKLQRMPTASGGEPSREIALTESEIRWLGEAQAVKRVYHLGGRDFLVTAIDGSRNRRAVHDPIYCWTVTKATEQPLPGGSGTVLRVVEEGIEKEVLFWFSDGSRKHASPARYLLQASWRRATLGWWGDEPLLVLVEPFGSAPVNWFRVTDGVPWLMEL